MHFMRKKEGTEQTYLPKWQMPENLANVSCNEKMQDGSEFVCADHFRNIIEVSIICNPYKNLNGGVWIIDSI